MNKSRKARICCAILICLEVMLLFIRGDHRGIRHADSFSWKGIEYIYASGKYHEGKTIAKTDDGSSINAVKEDPSHTFLVLRDFLDNDLYVREDYYIPTSGEISVAYWGDTITDEAFLSALTNIYKELQAGRLTDASYASLAKHDLRELYVGYESCPIATWPLGYLGAIDGVWYLKTIYISPRGGTFFSSFEIPSEYVAILEQYS